MAVAARADRADRADRAAARGAAAPGRAARAGTSLRTTALPLMPAALFLAVCVPMWAYAGSIAMTTHRVVLLAVIIPVVLRYVSGGAGRMRWVDLGVFLYVIWSLVTIGKWHPFTKFLEFGGSNSLEAVGGYLIGRVCIRSSDQFLRFAKYFIGLVLITLPFAIYESQTADPILVRTIENLPVVGSVAQIDTQPRLGLDRAQVVFPTPIHYGLFAAVAFSLAVVALTNHWSLQKRVVIGFAIFLCSFLSLSSGAFLALMLQLALLIWATVMSGTRLRWRILFIFAFSLYTVVEILSDRSAVDVFLAYATFSPSTAFHRSRIFDYGMDNVWANPVFGIGLHDWVRPSWMRNRSVDNFWLLTTMRHGFPGFLPLAAAWFGLIWMLSRLKLREGTDLYWIRRGYVFTMIGLSFSLATVHVWGGVYSIVFCLFGMGVWMLDADPETEAGRGGTGTGEGGGGTAAPAAGQPRQPARRYSRGPREDNRATGAAPEGRAFTRFPGDGRPDRQNRDS